MSLEEKNKSIKTGAKLYEISDTRRIETEIILPDYCREIKKLLKCTFTPGIHTVSLSGEKATAKGTGVIRVVYLGEGEQLDAFEKSCDLSSSVQMKDVPVGSAVTAKQKVDFLNCRVTGQRKLSVSFAVSTAFSCFTTKEESFVSSFDEDCICTKKEKLTTTQVEGYCEKTFDMSETVVLGDEHPAVEKIVSCDSLCTLESKKYSSGKLLLKGEVRVDICCLPEKDANKLHHITHTMPVSQIIDVGECKEDTSVDVELETKQLLCNLKSDSSGSNRLVELSLRVSAFVTATSKKEAEVITDCYCTECEIETVFELPEFDCTLREVNEALEHKGEVEFSSAVKEILATRCLDLTKSISCNEEKATVSCSALLGIIYLDENSLPCYCEKNLDFDFSYAIVKKSNSPLCDFQVDVLSLDSSLSGSDKAEFVLDYNVKGKIYCRHENKILRELTMLRDKPKKDKGVALTLYFPEKGEKLWDIARLHNTTTELIMRENGMKNENDIKEGMLLIPCV